MHGTVRCCLPFRMQVQYPNLLTLVVMLLAAWLTMSTWMSGNSFAVITLLSQGLVGVTTAFISGGVFVMSAWLPSHYVQASSHNSLSNISRANLHAFFPAARAGTASPLEESGIQMDSCNRQPE